MNNRTDQQLLRDYAELRSDDAFAELVRRHLDSVYSAARRMTGNDSSARDTAQAVFIALAQNAAQVARHPTLAGWLHTTARNLAAKTVRTEIRRQQREQAAATMNQLLAASPDPAWEHLAPHLDHALGELSDPDRDAVLLRYFEKKTAPEMARLLDISEEAAQKRAARALDRLRDNLARRGITTGAAGLAALLSVHAVEAAPAGLAATISATAVLSGTATTTVLTAAKTIIMTTLQKAVLTATLTVAVGAGIYQAVQTSHLRQQVATLQQAQAPLNEQIARLQAERDQLATEMARAKNSQALAQAQLGAYQKQHPPTPAISAKPPGTAAAPATPPPAGNPFASMITNMLGSGFLDAEMKKQANIKLSHMKEMLHLTDAQTQSIGDLLLKQSQLQSQQTMDLLSGKINLQQMKAETASQDNPDAEIKALLTPDQLAAYPAFEQAESTVAFDNVARMEASQIAGQYDLSTEQQEQIHTAFAQLAVNQSAAPVNADNPADSLVAQQKALLDQKLQVLTPILTPDQLASYRESQLNQIKMTTTAMQMFMPASPATK